MLPKILVVDDTAANLIAMRRLLARSNAQIFEAASGNEALAL
ncbi:MAG TPA: diguanylate cyclase response regulator, partial [Rhodanobacter sp.]|nr:diguanylate cyclase response regulator [Rhodanobacter sp.]